MLLIKGSSVQIAPTQRLLCDDRADLALPL